MKAPQAYSVDSPGILIAEFTEDANATMPSNRTLTQSILDATDVDTSRGSMFRALGRPIDPRTGRDDALKVAQAKGALAVVWGWYTKSSTSVYLTLHVDIAQSAFTKHINVGDPNKLGPPSIISNEGHSILKRVFTIYDFDS